jgi:hypothetical protein
MCKQSGLTQELSTVTRFLELAVACRMNLSLPAGEYIVRRHITDGAMKTHGVVVLDIFSRYVTGWMVAYRESAVSAKRLTSRRAARNSTFSPVNSPCMPIVAHR